jgi:hypothetical protein
MNHYETRTASLKTSVYFKVISVFLIAALLWLTGLPTSLRSANAASLTNVSDTLSDSDLGVRSGHTLNFTLQTALNDGGGADTIFVDFDPSGDNFTVNNIVVTDFVAESGLTVVSACTGAASEFTLSTTTADSFLLTICANDTVATSTVISLPIATTSNIVNPGVAQSYVIHIETRNQGSASSILDQADTRVAIIDDVVVTASVDTSFTFTIAGLPNGTDVNGVTTSTTTTATALAFGTLDPTTNASTTLGQRLTVATNAANGFTVTIRQDQNLTSATGADIDPFANGTANTIPTAWAYPANTLGSENTYGHFGITSEDDLNSSEFGTALFAGNFATTSRAVFHHNGPSDGTTANIGTTDIGFRIAITSLQEAGTDYTNTLTYVATPIF